MTLEESRDRLAKGLPVTWPTAAELTKMSDEESDGWLALMFREGLNQSVANDVPTN